MIFQNDGLQNPGKNCFLLNSVKEFIEIEACLLLTFFICSHNQLNSIYSIITYHGRRMNFERECRINGQKGTIVFGVCAFQVFHLKTEAREAGRVTPKYCL